MPSVQDSLSLSLVQAIGFEIIEVIIRKNVRNKIKFPLTLYV